MQILYKLLYVIVFAYILYHMYSFGFAVVNVAALILLAASLYLDAHRRRRRAEEARKRRDTK